MKLSELGDAIGPHPFPLSPGRARGNFVVQMAVAHLHDLQ